MHHRSGEMREAVERGQLPFGPPPSAVGHQPEQLRAYARREPSPSVFRRVRQRGPYGTVGARICQSGQQRGVLRRHCLGHIAVLERANGQRRPRYATENQEGHLVRRSQASPVSALQQRLRRTKAEPQPREHTQHRRPRGQSAGRRLGTGKAHDTVRAEHHMVELPLADVEFRRIVIGQQPAQQSATRLKDLDLHPHPHLPCPSPENPVKPSRTRS